MSWISKDDVATGNPIGMGSNLTFSGSGELDNGWGVALSVAMDNQDAYSNTNVTVTVPSIGAIQVSQGVSGTGIDRIDDVTPNVWEEAYAVGVGSGIDTIGGTSGGTTIEYTPSMTPAGLTARIAYSPDVGGSGAADKASAVNYSRQNSGYDITVAASEELHGVAG
jgi:outer membrane protein OmpU